MHLQSKSGSIFILKYKENFLVKSEEKCHENKIRQFKYKTVSTVALVSAKARMWHWCPEILVLESCSTENGMGTRKFTGWHCFFKGRASRSIVAVSHLTTLQFCPAGHNFLYKGCSRSWCPPPSSVLCLPLPPAPTSATIMHQVDSVVNYSQVRKWASL